jgi:hypothetical protein
MMETVHVLFVVEPVEEEHVVVVVVVLREET